MECKLEKKNLLKGMHAISQSTFPEIAKKDAQLSMLLLGMLPCQEKKISNIKFPVFAERLFKLKWLTAHEADDADLQHYEFIDSECSKHRNIFHIQ